MIAHQPTEPVDVRYISLVIFWPRFTNQISHIDQPNGAFQMCDMHLVSFLAKKYKAESRTSTNRAGPFQMCDMHLVIFLAKKYKAEYRTSTNAGTAP